MTHAVPPPVPLASGRNRAARRVRAHQCATCRTPWALRVVDHPAGKVVLCVHCGAVRAIRAVNAAAPGSPAGLAGSS